MPRGKWTGKVPNGKIIDSLVKKGLSREAISTMRATERQLILDRRQLTNLMMAQKQGSVQWKRYSNQINAVNRKLSGVSTFLRG